MPEKSDLNKVLRQLRIKKAKNIKEKLTSGRWWKVVSEEEKKLAAGLVHFISTEKKWPNPEDD